MELMKVKRAEDVTIPRPQNYAETRYLIPAYSATTL